MAETSGIRELRWVPADQLDDNPRNWRKHPDRQMKALAASIRENGWAGALLYNEVTGRLIDGHARKLLAIRAAKESGSNLVPVLVGRWTEEQEKRILATLDPISAMAEADTELLRKLTAELDSDLEEVGAKMEEENREAFQSIARELNSQAEAVDYGAPASFFPSDAEEFGEQSKPEPAKLENPKGETKGSFRLKTRDEIDWDAWGPGSTLDIPHLRPDRLASVPEPIVTWLGPKDTEPCDHYLYLFGSTALSDAGENYVVGFYVGDDRFERVWDSPEVYTGNMLELGVRTIVTPNFSCYDGMHKAQDVWQTYRSRWLGRYWQEAGLRVIPDLMLGNLVQDETWQWRFAGIPKNAPAVALQVQQKGERDPDLYYRQRHRQLLKVLDLLTPESLLLYRGPNMPEWFVDKLPDSLHVVQCETFMSGRSRKLEANKRNYVSRR